MNPKQYRRTTTDLIGTIGQSIKALAPFVNTWETDHAVSNNPQWKDNIENHLKEIERACAQLRQLQPPPQFQKAHVFAEQGSDLLATFAKRFREAIAAPQTFQPEYFTEPLKKGNTALTAFRAGLN